MTATRRVTPERLKVVVILIKTAMEDQVLTLQILSTSLAPFK